MNRADLYAQKMFNGAPKECPSFPQGYTYFAQMLAHDVVPATHPDCGRNFEHRSLSLTSLYGERFSALNENGYFQVNPNSPWDLPRDASGHALIPEPRNDQNKIIAQFHLLWQRLHNLLLVELAQKEGGTANVQRASELVVLTFQFLVIEDLLTRLLDERVFAAYFKSEQRASLKMSDSALFHFFDKAVFRFGHSLVRHRYRLRPHDKVALPLSILLNPQSKDGTIEARHQINWGAFFEVDQTVAADIVDGAMLLDTSIVSDMRRIPACHSAGTTNIVLANLIASNALTGAELCKAVLDGLDDRALSRQLGLEQMPDVGKAIKAPLDLTEEAKSLPAWLFVLSEAEQNMSNRLGPFASLIVAETVWRLMEAAPVSVIKQNSYDSMNAMKHLSIVGDKLMNARVATNAVNFTVADLIRAYPVLVEVT